MRRFSLFRRLRRRGLKPPGYRTDKPTKGAGKRGLPGYWSARFFVSVGVLLCVVPVHAQDESAVLYPGTYQAEDAHFTLPGDAKIVAVEGADGGKAVDTIRLDFDYAGTDIIVKWQGDSPITSDDCQIILPRDTPSTPDGWRSSRFRPFYFSGEHRFSLHTLSRADKIGSENPCLWVMNKSDETLRVDSITILDRTFEMIFPAVAAIGITVGMTLFVVISALRERWRR